MSFDEICEERANEKLLVAGSSKSAMSAVDPLFSLQRQYDLQLALHLNGAVQQASSKLQRTKIV